MVEVKLGAAIATRIEESYEPNFDAKMFFPDWKPEVAEKHMSWLSPHHYDAASGWLKLSIHSWLLKIGGKTILIDTCVGNHKQRPHRPKWHLMETRYLERLAAAGECRRIAGRRLQHRLERGLRARVVAPGHRDVRLPCLRRVELRRAAQRRRELRRGHDRHHDQQEPDGVRQRPVARTRREEDRLHGRQPLR